MLNLVKGDQGKVGLLCNAAIYANAEIDQTYFDHSSLNRSQLLSTTIQLYGLKYFWKLLQFPFQWRTVEDYTICTFYRNIKTSDCIDFIDNFV